MAVVISPVGGLGNQLFIYAAGKALAREHDLPLLVDTSHYRKYHNRLFELDSFDSQWEDAVTTQNYGFFLNQKLVQSFLRVRHLFWRLCQRGGRGLEEAFVFDPSFLKFGGNFWLSGYLQSWRYFDAVGDELRNEISRIENPTNFYRKAQKEILDATVSVAVHVRRGDYISNNYMGILPEKYYERSLNLLEYLIGDFQVFIFSDDTDSLIEESFLPKWAARMTILRASKDSRPVETLRLIAMCDHVVMANSSFSWWGAWLGQRENRQVIYPRPWLAGARADDRDFTLPTWISIGTE
jgi:hypothetical protein